MVNVTNRYSLADQVRRLEKKVEREKIVMTTLPEISLRIVEFVREHGRNNDRQYYLVDQHQPQHLESALQKPG
nr:hypothetical protein [Chlorobium ferrooxidans]